MKRIHLTLSGVLLATTALAAPGFGVAQTPATPPASVAGQTVPADAGPAEAGPAGRPEAGADAAPAPEPTEVEEVVVRGRFIPLPNRESPEVAAFVTAEDLVRTGDANAAEALTRVTGLSIVEGRFIYVRGLGERYSSALLNGSPLPSPEPLQRVVPLDLFPSEVLSGVTVQKTYSVNFPGEFGGGVIDLQTLSAPRRPFFSVSASTGFNSATTYRPGISYYGSDTDFLGVDDGTRDVPGPVQDAFDSGKRISAGPDFTATELRRIGQSLVNAPLRLIQNLGDVPNDVGLDVSGGRSFDVGWARLGFLGVVGYDNGWRTRDGVRQTGRIDAGELVVSSDFDLRSTQNDIGWNALGGVTLEADDHELKWTNLYVRNTTKEARIESGFDDLAGGVRRVDFTEWFERQLFSSQLTGEHFFGSDDQWELNWRAAYAKTTRDAPYETRVAYGLSSSTGEFLHDIQGTRISFGELDDEVVSGGVDLSYVLPLSESREAVFTAGLFTSANERASEQRDLRFIAPFGLTEEQRASRVDFLFSDALIGPFLQIEEVTGSNGASAYEARLKVDAAFFNVEAELLPLVNLTTGLRYEKGEQNVRPFDLLGGNVDFLPTRIEEEYLLPAATVTWNFAEDMQLRLAASKTIGRPQFRELAPQQYRDIESDRTFIGNPYLVDTELLNLDARYEWYFARQQYLTAGLFFKDLEKPVESSVVDQGASISQTFLNAPKARIAGAEVEVKKYFEFPDLPVAWLAAKRWLVQGNYTFTDSEVMVEDGDEVVTQNSLGVPQPASFYIIDGSRLQGQSDHVANLQFGFEDDAARTQATLLLTWVSERTSARGRPGEPDVVQEPGVMLDLVVRQGLTLLGRELTLGFEARNLLDEEFQEYQELGAGRIDLNRFDLGTSVSLSLSARF